MTSAFDNSPEATATVIDMEVTASEGREQRVSPTDDHNGVHIHAHTAVDVVQDGLTQVQSRRESHADLELQIYQLLLRRHEAYFAQIGSEGSRPRV